MGGHGALTLALRHPGLYHSLSALAPIVAPSHVPWGQKAFQGYLGSDGPGGPGGPGELEGLSRWGEHDACELVRVRQFPGEILLDQGTEDKFLDRELQPERFRAACAASGQMLQRRLHRGYDHSYFFIATFIEDHLRHHARVLLE
jgi:S-formylglutathione hydrolase